MVRSLAKLRQENERLRKKISQEGDLIKLQEERVRLSRQNKQILKQLKRSPTEKAIRRAFKGTGINLFKNVKTIGQGIVKYGRFLNEQEKKAKRKEKSLKKSSRKRRRR